MPVWDSWLYVSTSQRLFDRASFSVTFLLSGLEHSALKPQMYTVVSMTLEADGDSWMRWFMGRILCLGLLDEIEYIAEP